MISTINQWAVALSNFVELSILGKATVMLVLGLAVVKVAGHARASVRHLLLTATLATVLVLPLVVLAAPQITIWVPAAPIDPPVAVLPESPPPVVSSTSANISVSTPVAETTSWAPPSLTSIAWTVWVVGAVLLLFHLGVNLWRLDGIRRNGLPWTERREMIRSLSAECGIRRPVEVLLHERIIAPLTYGIWRPVILLPCEASEWTETDLRRALVHELEHVRRHDWVTQLIARVTCVFYWFHPLVWVASRSLSLQAERACDDAVVGNAERTEYAEQLVLLARRLTRDRTEPALGMANRSDLSKRVSALLDGSQRRGRAGLFAVASAFCIATLVVFAIAPVRAAVLAGKNPELSAEEPAQRSERTTWRVSTTLDERLVRAATRSDFAAIDELLKAGANVNGATDRQGEASPLIGAARQGQLEAVRVLLDRGADPNMPVLGDGSPLIGAAARGHLEVVSLLLDRGADPNQAVEFDGSPLIAAAEMGRTEVVRLLLDRGANVDQIVPGDENALIKASARGHLEVVKLLVSRGADVNARAWASAPKIVEFIRLTGNRKGWDVISVEKRSSQKAAVPIDEKVKTLQDEVVEFRRARTKPNAKAPTVVVSGNAGGDEGYRLDVVIRSAVEGDKKVVSASPNGEIWDDEKGGWRTPLIMARKAGHSAVVAFLLESGARE